METGYRAKMTKRFDIRNVENKTELLQYAEKKGIKFVEKPARQMYGFAGLHLGDAQAWGIKGIRGREIWIDRTMKPAYKFRIMRHEVEENALWKQGEPIWRAHKTAVKHEKYNSRNWRK